MKSVLYHAGNAVGLVALWLVGGVIAWGLIYVVAIVIKSVTGL